MILYNYYGEWYIIGIKDIKFINEISPNEYEELLNDPNIGVASATYWNNRPWNIETNQGLLQDT